MLFLSIEALVLLFFVIACSVIASRIIRSIFLLREFGTPVVISLFLVATLFLYVVPILSLLAPVCFPSSFFSPLPFVTLFFVPHLLLSRIPLRHLQVSGTCRVEVIERSLDDSVWLGYVGIA